MKKTGIEILQKFHKKPLDNLSLYVIYCIAFFTVYSIAEFIVSSITGVSHDTLQKLLSFSAAAKLFCAAC